MKLKKTALPERKQYDWDAVSATLRADKGEWYAVEDAPKVASTDIRRGSLFAFKPAGAFEACHRRGVLHVRFVGEPETPVAEPWRL